MPSRAYDELDWRTYQRRAAKFFDKLEMEVEIEAQLDGARSSRADVDDVQGRDGHRRLHIHPSKPELLGVWIGAGEARPPSDPVRCRPTERAALGPISTGVL